MQMNETEILGSYRRAENKKEQIQILADLNCCDNDTIIELLKKNGVPEEELSPKRGRKTKKAEIKVSVPTKSETPVKDDMALPFPEDVNQQDDTDPSHEIDRLTDDTPVIPIAVVRACEEKIDYLESQILVAQHEIDEIRGYLNGACQNG